MTLQGDNFVAVDSADDTFIRVSLFCRDVQWLKEALVEALLTMTRANNYLLRGTATAADVEDYGAEIFNSLRFGGDDMPVGIYVDWSGTIETAPETWLYCDGSTYGRVFYPALYEVIHPDLIIDADTFSVPDLRVRGLVGAGDVVLDESYPVLIEPATYLGFEASLQQHHHNLAVELLGIQLGATDRYMLDFTFAYTDTFGTQTTGGHGDRGNYHPSFAVHKFIVAE